MNSNFNLPPGVSGKDISSEHECPQCGGSGSVEVRRFDSFGQEYWEDITCPTCSGLGVFNTKSKTKYD